MTNEERSEEALAGRFSWNLENENQCAVTREVSYRLISLRTGLLVTERTEVHSGEHRGHARFEFLTVFSL